VKDPNMLVKAVSGLQNSEEDDAKIEELTSIVNMQK
jgi:hypothetical protein